MTPDPDLLYHFAIEADWQRAQPAGVYETSTLGMSFAEVGFVHASFAHQVRATADRFYVGRDDVVLLSIDPARLASHPVVEAIEGSDEGFPHLFDPLPVEAVVAVEPAAPAPDGRLDLTAFDPPTEVSFELGRLDVAEAEAAAAVNSRSSVAGFGHVFPAEMAPPPHAVLADLWRGWLGDAARVGHGARLTDGRLVGVGVSGPDPRNRDVGHLAKIYVEPWFWRLGIGRAVYDAGVDELARRGFDRATLHVLDANRRARRWYEALGWTPTGRPIEQVPGHLREVEYELRIP